MLELQDKLRFYGHFTRHPEAALAARDAAMRNDGRRAVKVKPLMWETIGKDPQNYEWKAKKPFGSAYYIHRNEHGDYCWFAGSHEYGTLESAKAAAQADYEARILSALEPEDNA